MRSMTVPNRASMIALAVAMVAGPSPAAAQSLQGTPTVSVGSASVNEGSGTTTVTVDTDQTVIDWLPDDNAVGNFGAINFQPSGTTATFQNNIDLVGDFAVLNRINVADQTRIVALNGTINSLVNGQTGGAIYFYSPSGFVLTGTSVINVGSLVLSASPITVNGQGQFIVNGSVEFGQAPNPNAAINTVSDINGTSQISASGNGSYVALVAPTILHQGDIKTDGAAALVAAEAATINFSPDGLFNIAVTVGTDAANGIHVDGGTIGRNSATEGADHRAYLVAVAKNDAVTMLINNGGSLGFDTATSAQAGENNVVVLSGGYDISGGDQLNYSGVSEVPLTITNAAFSSNVDAKVTGGAAVNSGQGALTFSGDLTVIGGAKTTTGGNVLIDGLNGNALSIGGDLMARAFRQNAGGAETGLITRLGAEGGSTVTVSGSVTLDSASYRRKAIHRRWNGGGNATGGNAQVNVGRQFGNLNVIGSADLDRRRLWRTVNQYGDATGGNGIGGQALVMANQWRLQRQCRRIGLSCRPRASAATTGECTSCNVTGGNGRADNASIWPMSGSGNKIDHRQRSCRRPPRELAGQATPGRAGIGGTANLGCGQRFDRITSMRHDRAPLSMSMRPGFGGEGFEGANGGLGRGGTAHIGSEQRWPRSI